MLHEAFYPNKKSHNQPRKAFYGFVQEDRLVHLVIFDAKATATSLLGQTLENQSEFVHFLLKKHMCNVAAEFIKVVFIRAPSEVDKLYGESWSIEVNSHYVKEKAMLKLEQWKAKLKFNKASQFFGTTRINKRDLTIDLTNNITLFDLVYIDQERAEYLLNKLKKTDYGDFNFIFNN